jgi:hypothetical protein
MRERDTRDEKAFRCACGPGDISGEMENMTKAAVAEKAEDKRLRTVPLNWKEVYYTNCPLVSASNVDQELGWTKEEYKKIGVSYLYLRSRKENDWYPTTSTTSTT